MKLTLVRGIPGSGKTTFSRNNYRCLILENDMFSEVDGKYCWSQNNVKKGIALVRTMAEMTLANGNDVVVCNTFTKKSFIEKYKELADEFGADFEVIRCTGNFKNVHDVPEHIFNNMKNNFEDWPGETYV